MLASHSDLARITSDITGGETNSRSQFQVREKEAPQQPELEQDVAAPEVERQEELLEVPEDLEERRAMKRASADPEPKLAAKPKPEAPKGAKRPGGLFIRRELQAKVKLSEKREKREQLKTQSSYKKRQVVQLQEL